MRQTSPHERTGPRLLNPDHSLRQAPPDPSRLDRVRRGLLILEIQQLENMLATMPKKAPDRPLIMRRLAEGYAELAAQAEREQLGAQARVELEDRQAAQVSPVPKSRPSSSPYVPRPPSRTMF